jgi:hypothetical protein
MKEEHSSGSGGGHYVYYAIVRFRTEKNIVAEFKDNVGSNLPSHRPGDKVTVLYLPGNQQQDAIIDRGIWWNWAIPACFYLPHLFCSSSSACCGKARFKKSSVPGRMPLSANSPTGSVLTIFSTANKTRGLIRIWLGLASSQSRDAKLETVPFAA